MNLKGRKTYFESERLLFFRPTEEDMEVNLKWITHPEAMKGEKKALDENESRASKEFSMQHWERHGFGNFTAVLKTNHEQVGMVGLKFFTPQHHIPDLGYLVYPPFQRQGLATEAARALIAYANRALGFKTFQALSYADNEPSSKILQKLGFKVVGRETLFYLGRDWGESTKWELEVKELPPEN